MKTHNRQGGMVLLVSLVLLLVLTIIAITAANTSSLQVRIAANSKQQNVAFQAAESGIREWLADFAENPAIEAMTVTGNLQATAKTVPYQASAASPGTCWDVIPAYSLDASEDNTSFQYACFNIQSTGKACADATENADCPDDSQLAQAQHIQGHLVRY